MRGIGNWAVIVLLAALLTPVTTPADAEQDLVAPPADPLLDQAYGAMYNLDFDMAFQKAEQAKAVAPADPMPWIATASATLFRELNRLHILRSELFSSDKNFDSRPAGSWNPQAERQFNSALSGAEQLAQNRLLKDKADEKGLLAMALSNGLRADDAALISKKNLSALSFVKSGNAYADRLLARWPDCYDAYVATGMGKYVVGLKAAPVRWMLRIGGIKGDQAEGLKELSLAAQRGHYLAPFARILLAFDDLRHNRTLDARRIFASLHEQFPSNPLFPQEMAKIDQLAHSGGPGE